MSPPIIVVNFAHPITTAQLVQIEQLCGEPIERVIDVTTQLDHDEPFAPQIARLVDVAGLTSAEWQTLPLVVNPPSYGPAIATLIAYLHGKLGHFPATIRLRPVVASTVPIYEVAEVLRLDQVREEARAQRWKEE